MYKRRMRGGDAPQAPVYSPVHKPYRTSPSTGYKPINFRVHNKVGEAKPLHKIVRSTPKVHYDGFKSKRTKHCSPGYVKRQGKCYKGIYSAKRHSMIKSRVKRRKSSGVKRRKSGKKSGVKRRKSSGVKRRKSGKKSGKRRSGRKY